MKLKNLLKKSISTLLCVSTLTFSTGIIPSMGISSYNLIRGFNKTNNSWSDFEFLTPDSVNKFFNGIYEVCDLSGQNCKVYNQPLTLSNVLFGGLKLVGNVAKHAFNGLISTIFSPISMGLMFFSLKNSIENALSKYFNKNCGKINESQDSIEALERLNIYLEPIKGQDNVKEELRKFVLSSVDEKNQRVRGLSKKKGANIIYLVGPSGVGKSMSAEALAKVFTGDESKPYVVEPSDIDKESKKASVVDQLFGMRTKKVNMSEMYEMSPLVKQVQATPNMVLIINEYDKMWSKDLDEKLRTISDHGYVNVNGEMVDFSKLTIIITSNEDFGSVTKGDHEDDGTGSRTQIDHDKAFLNRLKIVEFNNLSAENYVEIVKPMFLALQQRYLNDYNVFVTFEDDLFSQVAKLVEQKNQGARPIQAFVDNVNDKLLTQVILKGSKDKSYIGKTVNVSLEEKNDISDFVLTESIDYTKVLQILIDRLKDTYLSNYKMNLEFSDETINNLAEFLNKHNASTNLASSIINSLNKDIAENIISKDKKEKSFIGKSYNIRFDNQSWEISEINPS